MKIPQYGSLCLTLVVGISMLSPAMAEESESADNGTDSGMSEMPTSADETRFHDVREAVAWRRQELKDIERLVRQLRFDLVNNKDARGAAPRLQELQDKAAGERLLPAFIEGTHGRGSDARPEIWEDWEDFAAGFDELEQRIAELVDAAEAEDYAKATQALSSVGLSCRSCHRAYRYD